jgi:serine/threonine protein kinase
MKLLYTIKYLHDIGFSHRDLKLDNIMIKSGDSPAAQIEVKIIDFGLSKRFDPDDNCSGKFTSLVGTPHYLAPEVLN